jgi:hypothetical protein
MSDLIRPGTIFFRQGTSLPNGVSAHTEPRGQGWKRVTGLDAYAFGRAIAKLDWTFFALADELKSTAFGFNSEKRVGKAVDRMVASLHASEFNAVEIMDVRSKRFFGVPYTTLRARSRHIQQGAYILHSTDFHSLIETSNAVS